mmetsp:Transcript_30858/g.70132  ORF Transcript_30858/g.70132 Transcript_30858/m.70132 type:complete len:434 (-) Transcript_30858:38-1339(-)
MESVSAVLAKRGVKLSLLVGLLAVATQLKPVRSLIYFLLSKIRGGASSASSSSNKWPLDEWVDLRREEAIDPDMEIIDPHHHLWDPRYHPKGWPIPLEHIQMWFAMTPVKELNKQALDGMLQDSVAAVDSFVGRSRRQAPFTQPYMGEELSLDIRNRDCGKRGHNIVKTVYLECGWDDKNVEEPLRPLGEVAMVAKVHEEFPKLCNGMVAYAKLDHPEVETTLKGLKENPLVRGIRHSLSWTADKGIAGAGVEKDAAMTPEFRKGFALLEKYGLSYDVWMFHEQLGNVTDLVRSFPNTTVIIDHVAEPLGISTYDRETTFPIWEKGMRELAKASKNVYVKLSGLSMCRTGFHFDDRAVPPSSEELAKAWGKYFKVVLDAFGVDRCMFASNFPVDKVSTDYTVLFNSFKLIVKDYSEADKRALFYENAKRVYRL